MAYKIYQKLKSGMAALGLIDSTDIDTAYDHKTNGVVDRKMTQEEMNALFNQGKGLDGQGQEVQLGKTYKAGTGLSLTPSASGDEFSLDAANTSSIGGIQLSSVPGSYAEENTSFPVVGVSGASTAKVEVPMANTTHSGLMSKALFDKLSALPTRAGLTTELGNKANKSIITSSSEAANTESATTAHAKGSYFFIGDVLYRALDAINENDAIVTDSTMSGYNAAAVTIEGEMGRCINGMQLSTKAPFSSLSALTTFISNNNIALHTNDYAFIIGASAVAGDSSKYLRLYKYNGIQWGQDCEILKTGDGIGFSNNGNELYVDFAQTDEVVYINVTTSVTGISVAGVEINVYYNDSSTSTETLVTDNNGQTMFRVANGSKYKLEFPEKSGCETINPIIHTATLASRTINVEYKEPAPQPMETVKVYVGTKNGSVISPSEGTTVNVVYSNVNHPYSTDNNGIATFTVTYGVTYTVSFATPSGYYIYGGNTSQQTASQAQRTLTFICFSYNCGLFYVDADGYEYSQSDFDALTSEQQAILAPQLLYIKVATSALLGAGTTFLVHVDTIVEQDGYGNKAWAGQNVGFNSIPMNGNISTSQYYYDGYTASVLIKGEGEDRNINTLAVNYALEKYVTIGETTCPGFVGSAGQWQSIIDNMSIFDSMLKTVRNNTSNTLTALLNKNENGFWTSAQNTTLSAFYALKDRIFSDNGYKVGARYVLPFFQCRYSPVTE